MTEQVPSKQAAEAHALDVPVVKQLDYSPEAIGQYADFMRRLDPEAYGTTPDVDWRKALQEMRIMHPDTSILTATNAVEDKGQFIDKLTGVLFVDKKEDTLHAAQPLAVDEASANYLVTAAMQSALEQRLKFKLDVPQTKPEHSPN